MSEELLQTIPQNIGGLTYYKLGNTTLNQLKNAGIIPKHDYGKLWRKKPDGLVLHQDTIRAVVEYKQSSELSSDNDLKKAIKQEIEVAAALCKLLIVTDGSKSYWINAKNGEFITDKNGIEVRSVFNPLLVKNVDEVEHLVNSIDASIDVDNSTIRSAKLVESNPSSIKTMANHLGCNR